MDRPAKLLVVDDTPMNVKLLADRLTAKGYEVATAGSGAQALEQIKENQPDLVLLDVVMPQMSGYEVCRALREAPETRTLPGIMVTALDPDEERIKGLDAGADDFLSKPVNQPELEARVRSLLRIKQLNDELQEQRLGRLRRFLSPQVADLVISSGEDSMLASHRSRIAALFCDLRGFTGFSETAEPEDVIDVLQTYHEAMGRLIDRFDGTIDHRAGDGIMVIFNDPVPCDDPARRAVEVGLAMHTRMHELKIGWRRLGYELGFSVGVSLGYATIGLVGFEGRLDYTANGSVVNLASRLCDEAQDGQLLVSQRAYAALGDTVDAKALEALTLKGFHEPVAAYEVNRLERE